MALTERRDFRSQGYRLSASPTRISRCGQVLFAAATPHGAVEDVASKLKAANVKRRFNIMFFVQQRATTPRMFRVVKGPKPLPVWVRGEDNRWERTPIGEAADDPTPEVATHLYFT